MALCLMDLCLMDMEDAADGLVPDGLVACILSNSIIMLFNLY